MYSCDIESVCASIPTELGLETFEYWIMRKGDVIPRRFIKEFILEAIELILKSNSFLFDTKMFNQIIGTAMGTKCAPQYACLTIGYQEETKLFTKDLPKYFSNEECLLIKDSLKDIWMTIFFLANTLDFNSFSICLNN